MSSVEEKYFLRLIKFSYDLSLKVTRTFTHTNILNLYDNSLTKFLDVYKHDIYHLWNNNTRCCACSPNALKQQHRELNKDQFTKLYDIKGTTSHGHFKKGAGNSVIQHCLCGVTCVASCSLNDLDIILIHTIIRKCSKLSTDDDMWLQTIREIRNNLAHAVSTTDFDQGRLEKWWTKLEGSVIGLSGKVPPLSYYAESIEDQIKLLKKFDLDRNDVQEILSEIAVENAKILLKQEEFTEDVKQKSEEIKEEIIHHLEKNRDMLLIDIKNLMFKVVTNGLQQKTPDEVEKNEKSPTQDSGTCYVEWRVKTPDDWQVERIREKLNLLKAMLQDSFKLEFVYVGSLVIETSVQRQVITDTDLLIPSVRSFLERIVEVCNIDTETAATVQIDLSVIQQLHTGLPIIVCDVCQCQNKAVSWCPGCNVSLCADCRSNHEKDHHTIDVTFKSDIQNEIENQQYCTEHAQRKVEYFCPEHDCLCCQKCLDDMHKPCPVKNIDDVCKDTGKPILEELGTEISNINKTLSELEEETQIYSSDVNTQSQNIESKIVQAMDTAINHIHKTAKKLLSEIQEENRKTMVEKYELKTNCKTISEKLALRLNLLEFIKEHGTEKQAFILARHLIPTVDNIADSVSNIISSIIRITFSFDDENDLISDIGGLGKIIKSEQSSQVKYTWINEKHAQCVIPRTDKPLTSFKLTSTVKTSGFVKITGMIVTEDNKLLLCDNNEHKVLVCNDDGHYASTIKTKHRPWDIAVIPGADKYVVTLPSIDSIQYIKSKDLTPGRCAGFPTRNRVKGIAADNQYIYVGDFGIIWVLNHQSSVVREIKVGVSNLSYLALSDNDLYASDSSDHIYCFKGGVIKKLNILRESFTAKIIVDRHGYIYVGRGSGKVYQLDKELNQIMEISDDSIKKITAICFNKDCTKLFVACDRGIATFICS